MPQVNFWSIFRVFSGSLKDVFADFTDIICSCRVLGMKDCLGNFLCGSYECLLLAEILIHWLLFSWFHYWCYFPRVRAPFLRLINFFVNIFMVHIHIVFVMVTRLVRFNNYFTWFFFCSLWRSFEFFAADRW